MLQVQCMCQCWNSKRHIAISEIILRKWLIYCIAKGLQIKNPFVIHFFFFIVETSMSRITRKYKRHPDVHHGTWNPLWTSSAETVLRNAPNLLYRFVVYVFSSRSGTLDSTAKALGPIQIRISFSKRFHHTIPQRNAANDPARSVPKRIGFTI